MKQINEASPQQICDFLHSCGGNELRAAIEKLSTPCLLILNSWIADEMTERLLPEAGLKKNGMTH